MKIEISNREFDTILAALRIWQRLGNEDQPEIDIATNGGESPNLSVDEIDGLCEELNSGVRDI